jgi:hypothetical protein
LGSPGARETVGAATAQKTSVSLSLSQQPRAGIQRGKEGDVLRKPQLQPRNNGERERLYTERERVSYILLVVVLHPSEWLSFPRNGDDWI